MQEASHNWRVEGIVVAAVMLVVLSSRLPVIPGSVSFAVSMPGWATAVETYRADEWEWGRWSTVGIILMSWLFWSILGLAIVSLGKRRITSALVLAAFVIGSGYYLGFRTTCLDAFAGTMCLYRSWGSITRVVVESADRKYETWWRWYPPYRGTHTGQVIRSRSDQNGDGRWDTWLDYGAKTLKIDVDGDQSADHTLTLDHAGWERARAIRGYQ